MVVVPSGERRKRLLKKTTRTLFEAKVSEQVETTVLSGWWGLRCLLYVLSVLFINLKHKGLPAAPHISTPTTLARLQGDKRSQLQAGAQHSKKTQKRGVGAREGPAPGVQGCSRELHGRMCYRQSLSILGQIFKERKTDFEQHPRNMNV